MYHGSKTLKKDYFGKYSNLLKDPTCISLLCQWCGQICIWMAILCSTLLRITHHSIYWLHSNKNISCSRFGLFFFQLKRGRECGGWLYFYIQEDATLLCKIQYITHCLLIGILGSAVCVYINNALLIISFI